MMCTNHPSTLLLVTHHLFFPQTGRDSGSVPHGHGCLSSAGSGGKRRSFPA